MFIIRSENGVFGGDVWHAWLTLPRAPARITTGFAAARRTGWQQRISSKLTGLRFPIAPFGTVKHLVGHSVGRSHFLNTAPQWYGGNSTKAVRSNPSGSTTAPTILSICARKDSMAGLGRKLVLDLRGRVQSHVLYLFFFGETESRRILRVPEFPARTRNRSLKPERPSGQAAVILARSSCLMLTESRKPGHAAACWSAHKRSPVMLRLAAAFALTLAARRPKRKIPLLDNRRAPRLPLTS